MQTLQKPYAKSDRTRSFIVERSAEVFNKKGFSGTSMSDVQAATGLSRGGIYGCFESKEMIALAVFDYNMGKICDIVSEKSKKARSFHDKLLVFADVYKMIGHDSHFTGGSPLLNTASESDDTNGLLRQRVSKALIKKEKGIAHIIDMGVDTGEFKKNINASALAHNIISFLEGGLMIARATNDLSKLDRMYHTIDDMISQIRN